MLVIFSRAMFYEQNKMEVIDQRWYTSSQTSWSTRLCVQEEKIYSGKKEGHWKMPVK